MRRNAKLLLIEDEWSREKNLPEEEEYDDEEARRAHDSLRHESLCDRLQSVQLTPRGLAIKERCWRISGEFDGVFDEWSGPKYMVDWCDQSLNPDKTP